MIYIKKRRNKANVETRILLFILLSVLSYSLKAQEQTFSQKHIIYLIPGQGSDYRILFSPDTGKRCLSAPKVCQIPARIRVGANRIPSRQLDDVQHPNSRELPRRAICGKYYYRCMVQFWQDCQPHEREYMDTSG